MGNILTRYQDQYLADTQLAEILAEADITLLTEFLSARPLLEQFWAQYIPETLPRTVILGLNPGRLGAGQTGIPFMDFRTLSVLLPEGQVRQPVVEPSASFFYRVVLSLGAERFYRQFYVSNVSTLGYLQGGRNVNYSDLPLAGQKIVAQRFAAEMAEVQPQRIVVLGREAEASARALYPDGSVEISHLPHPAWIMTYRLREAQSWVRRYGQMLLGA